MARRAADTPSDRILSSGEAARLMGFSTSRLIQLCELRKIPVAFRTGLGHRFFRESEIRPLAEARAKQQTLDAQALAGAGLRDAKTGRLKAAREAKLQAG